MNFTEIKFQIFNLDCTTSTNIHALRLAHAKKVKAGDVFVTRQQTEGKGQRGSSWQSDPAKNLLFSVVFEPDLGVDKQFFISQSIALALHAYLDSLSVGEVQVKWPNDLLINREKVGGILIENVLEGSRIKYSVVGVGLNVNQVRFEKYKHKATSLKLLKDKDFDLEETLVKFLDFLKRQWNDLEKREFEKLTREYLGRLYGYRTSIRLKGQSGEFFGTIVGVAENGHLQVEKEGVVKSYDLKEVEFCF